MSAEDGVDRSLLHAYVDGELTPEAAAEIDRILAERPDLREEVEAWRAQKAQLKAALSMRAAQPPRRRAAPSAPARGGWLMRTAAGLALLALGLAGGYGARGMLETPPAPDQTARLMEEALAAHAVFAEDPRRPVELAADERALLDRWLSNRVGRPLAAPDLSASGLEFLGGRLVAADGRPAALFVYKDIAGRRVSLMISAPDADQPRPPAPERPMRRDAPQAVSALLWADGPLRMVLTGEGPAASLENAAESLRGAAL